MRLVVDLFKEFDHDVVLEELAQLVQDQPAISRRANQVSAATRGAGGQVRSGRLYGLHHCRQRQQRSATPGSLRWAIIQSNQVGGNPNTIFFNIPGGGEQTISVAVVLPTITQAVVIDGYSQPGSTRNTLAVGDNATILIDLDGGRNNFNGLTIDASLTTVDGLAITNFNQNGIDMEASGGNIIVGDFIGTDPSGAAGQGNGAGVLVNNISGNHIGGAKPRDRDVISGNDSVDTSVGVIIQGAQAGNNHVFNSYIGVSPQGTVALPNSGDGVLIQSGAVGNEIGGSIMEFGQFPVNVISGNGMNGVEIKDAASAGNQVTRNIIGLPSSGTDSVGNIDGIYINQANSSTISGNTISGNTNNGIHVADTTGTGANGHGTIISGNFIGTDTNGLHKAGTQAFGVFVDNVTQTQIGIASSGNVISGNGGGILISGQKATSNTVVNNLIGMDKNGVNPVGNTNAGIDITSQAKLNTIGETFGSHNVISGNKTGIDINASTFNTIVANYIGTDITGKIKIANTTNGITLEFGSNNNTIGGTGGVSTRKCYFRKWRKWNRLNRISNTA